MSILHIVVQNRIATYNLRDGDIVCGNNDYQIEFVFDSEWDAYNHKIARFIWNGQYTEVPFTGNTCVVPMMQNTDKLTVGVHAGDLRTTTPAEIACKRSILCMGGELTDADKHYTSVAEKAAETAVEASATAVSSEQNSKQYLDETKEIATQFSGDIEYIRSSVSRNDKRITNLEQGIPAELFETDASVAYQKVVPSDARSYGMVSKVGGMSRKCKNLVPNFTKTYSTDTFGVTQSVTATANAITLKGTSTSSGGRLGLSSVSSITLPAGTYTFSVTANGTYQSDVFVYLSKKADNSAFKGTVIGSYVTFTLTETTTLVIGLPYEPYYSGLRDTKVTAVKSVGANLFDDKNANVINGYIDTNSGVVSLTSTTKSVYIPCMPNTQYTVSKQLGARFAVGFCNVIPNSNVTVSNAVDKRGYESITVTSPSNAKYMVVWCYHSSYDTISFDEIISTIMLTKGTTALPYTPYVEHTLPIPEAVRNLDGYGLGLSAEYNNYIDWEKKQFVKRISKVDLSTVVFTLSSTATVWTAPFRNSVIGNIGVCDSYNFIPQTSVAIAPDKTIQLRNDGLIYVKDSEAQSGGDIAGVLVYGLATPEVTDISDLITSDNLIGVEGNGTITFENEYGYAVPSEVTYQLKGATA